MANAQFVRFIGGGGGGSTNRFAGEIIIFGDATPRVTFQRADGSALSSLRDDFASVGMVYRDDAAGLARTQWDRTTGKLVVGTVPLDQMATGAALLDATTNVLANTLTSITIQATAAAHRFYAYSMRGSGTTPKPHGCIVNIDETVDPNAHNIIVRASSTGNDLLQLRNGQATANDYIYKLYELTES